MSSSWPHITPQAFFSPLSREEVSLCDDSPATNVMQCAVYGLSADTLTFHPFNICSNLLAVKSFVASGPDIYRSALSFWWDSVAPLYKLYTDYFTLYQTVIFFCVLVCFVSLYRGRKKFYGSHWFCILPFTLGTLQLWETEDKFPKSHCITFISHDFICVIVQKINIDHVLLSNNSHPHVTSSSGSSLILHLLPGLMASGWKSFSVWKTPGQKRSPVGIIIRKWKKITRSLTVPLDLELHARSHLVGHKGSWEQWATAQNHTGRTGQWRELQPQWQRLRWLELSVVD